MIRPGRLTIAVAVLMAGACASTAGLQPTPANGASESTTPPEPASSSTGPDGDDASEASTQPHVDRPNVVVFMTDDQTLADLAAMTTVVERLGPGGSTFSQAFVNVPECCPSRATFLTGQHASTHGVLRNSGVNGGFRRFDDQDTALPAMLDEVGYQTIFVGKYLNGFALEPVDQYTPPGWDDFRGLMSPTEVLYVEPSFWVNGGIVDHGADDHVIDVMTEYALASLDTALETDDPFFAWISYPTPHAQAGLPRRDFDYRMFFLDIAARYSNPFLTPPVPLAEHVGRHADVTLGATPSFESSAMGSTVGFLDVPAASARQLELATAFRRGVLDSLLGVDASIAAILDRLESAGVVDNTWFIFTSDNGLLLGEHRQYGMKYLPFEETVRVPLVIAGPGVQPAVIDQVVSNVDLAPTIVELATAEPLRTFDGRSLVGLMQGSEQAVGRAVLIEGYEFGPRTPPYKAVHTGDSTYVEWATGERQLYDLSTDPNQLSNLVNDASYRDLLERNQGLLRDLLLCEGHECAEIGESLEPAGEPGGQ